MEALFLTLIGAAVLGVIPAMIAASKGRTFFLWWIYGAALFIIALPHALLTNKNVKVLDDRQLADGMRKCPACAELVRHEALVCRFCQRDLPPIEERPKTSAAQEEESIKVMDEYGITFDGLKYYRKGKPYPSLNAAVEIERDVPVTWGRER